MSKLNVLVLFGGNSTEHEISKKSVKLIINNLSTEKYNIIPVYISRNGTWYLYDGNTNNISDINIERAGTRAILSPDTSHKGIMRIVGDKFKILPVDVAIPVLHGKNGEDGTIQGLLELANIPYVGNNVLTSAVAMDKEFTKILVNNISNNGKGINQAKYLIFNYYEKDNINEFVKQVKLELNFPVFVKPANAGSSIGVSKAINKKELIKSIEEALLFDKKVIVEEEIIGREIECAVLGFDNKIVASPIGEILSSGAFYDYNSKYVDTTSKTTILTEIDGSEDILNEVRVQAAEIFNFLDGRGLSRVDFFLEKGTNKIIFNEINTFPGLTEISMYPILMSKINYPPKILVDELIRIALTV